jgi:hypothetical protein
MFFLYSDSTADTNIVEIYYVAYLNYTYLLKELNSS